MKLTPEQLQNNWDQLIKLIENTFKEDRKDNLLKMYEYFEDRMMFAPASGIVYYHNSFPGGYVLHILNVTKFALEFYEIFNKFKFHTSEYTKENIIFCTLHHDLGKVGNLQYDYYVPNESEWHRINQGKMYEYNNKLHYMTVTDRAFYLLNHFNVKINEIEFLGLRLTDGMYEEANKTYLSGYGEDKNLKTNLPNLLHIADMLATRWEKEQYMFGKNPNIQYQTILHPETVAEETVKNNNDVKQTSQLSKKSQELFDELFGDKK